jgi:hypothetical protein
VAQIYPPGTGFPFRRLLWSWSWSSYGRQSVAQFVWVSGLPLGSLTRFYLALLSSSDSYFILLSKAPSLTRKRVCSLQRNHSLVRLLTPNNHTLPSHLRLCSLFVASYDSQGLRWKYWTRLHTGCRLLQSLTSLLYNIDCMEKDASNNYSVLRVYSLPRYTEPLPSNDRGKLV